jgi:hypothetical protein
MYGNRVIEAVSSTVSGSGESSPIIWSWYASICNICVLIDSESNQFLKK